MVSRLRPETSVEETAHKLAAILTKRHPGLLTGELLKRKRGGRVLVDWMRNTRLATVVAPWSLRARARATVAMPITWDELDDVAPDAFTIRDDLERTDHVLRLPPADPKRLGRAVDEIVTEQGIELEHVDRFGRRRRRGKRD